MIKRVFDIAVSLALLIVLSPLIIVVSILIMKRDGRPVLFVSERMKTVDQPFALYKFRTMRNDPNGTAPRGVTGGDKSDRITPIGHVLRRYRLDEIPQLLNVLKGDMSLVGPRPPLRQYTAMFPELYAQVLSCRPGVTGLASLIFHDHEERLIAHARTEAETNDIYVRRCIPRKAKLDIIYARNVSVFYDLKILWMTAAKVFVGRKG
jgi:lipopolysaccharide/colanic/teichoic acid biosynthesis glycosyltransferase